MKVTFLGTGTSQGIPVIACTCEVCQSLDYRDKRLRTSVLIEHHNTSFVIDTGPDFRQQMLRERVNKLDAVVFTHSHKDHTAGLDDVRAFNHLQQRDMLVYGDSNVLKALRQEFSYVFSENRYPGIPSLDLHEISTLPFTIGDILITPVEVMHYKLPILGFRIGDFTYITDANFISEEEQEKIKGSKVIVLNALHKDKHISHFNLEQAIDLLTKLKPEKAYLIHLGHRMGLHSKVSKELPDFIEIAYDGLQLML
ncbi:MAG TPA: MBL fold metallo-hydrolase [Cytophagaceae bacterium]|nr:MBL fold metallo-hydrolase [Cytophagaceae bacterium]